MNCHKSAASLSASNVSPVTQTIAPVSRKLQGEGHNEQGVSTRADREVAGLGENRKMAQVPCVWNQPSRGDWLQKGFITSLCLRFFRYKREIILLPS